MNLASYIKKNVPIIFRYFGSKTGIARRYPSPAHDTVIEPFAGSAAYSCLHHQRRVILFDKDPVVFGVLNYVIKATPEEIMRLPTFYGRESIDDYKIPQEAKWLIGFWMGIGNTQPRKTRSAWGRNSLRRATYWGDDVKRRVAATCRRIKHWEVYNKAWEDVDPEQYAKKACWFVDPPYQEAGTIYKHGAKAIDFKALGAWCRALPGQVIVCENWGADWLPFRDLYFARKNGYNKGGRTEVVWTKNCPQVGFGLIP